MNDRQDRAVAIVGVAALLPDAPSAPAFRDNVRAGRYSITEVPPDRWSVADYYDPDPAAPDKTYSKIGGWVRGFEFDWKRFHVPPRVAAAMDGAQQWAVTLAAEALADYGHPGRALDLERTGVVLGTAMGGELHYLTTLRICFPEYAHALEGVREFEALPATVRHAILERWHEKVGQALPPITEDTMPGELANVLSGRVANILNLRGPNFITDAACASALAALESAMDLLADGQCDAVITGGVDRNMGPGSFVKFCKIGALSATGTRPFGAGADGFVMGEGGAVFLLKRLADAERDGDRVYAVVRGVGGASDGKGKGITAPNPLGQQAAMRRAWDDAGLDPATCTMVEAHGTSTRVGDVVEVESLAAVFGQAARGSVALGSAKSNVGHLKAAAGAAGLLKALWALHDKVLPPTLHAHPPNPAIDFAGTPFTLDREARDWPRPNGDPRRAGVSAYGFGGTNFHAVLEEHVPGALTRAKRPASVSVETSGDLEGAGSAPGAQGAIPPRGILALGGASRDDLARALADARARVQSAGVPAPAAPDARALSAPERLVIDHGDAPELLDRLARAEAALAHDAPAAWRALQAQGIFRGRGRAQGRIAFLFPGQGSQWVNMGRELVGADAVAAAVFTEADAVMEPILGRPLTSYLFADPGRPEAVAEAERDLSQTAVTQPAVLAVDAAIDRLLRAHGFQPDVVMGHSLGEYAALVSAGALPLADALEAVAARGREMTRVSVEDNGWMAAIMAPFAAVEEILAAVDGYVVAANVNSRSQCVIGGASEAVRRAMEACQRKGYQAVRLPVSHAFHTRIVEPASGPLREVFDRLRFSLPQLPVVSNVTGDFYPPSVDAIKGLLQRQVASTVRWVDGLEALYAAGVRTFVEVGPKRALKGFVDDVFAGRDDVVSLSTNHPRPGELQAFNHALCGLYAAGHGRRATAQGEITVSSSTIVANDNAPATSPAVPPAAPPGLEELGRWLAVAVGQAASAGHSPADRNAAPSGSVVISGAGLGLPGAEKPVMDEDNVRRILRGEQMVDLIPQRFRDAMVDRHITRLVKGEDGGARFDTIEDAADVIKLAGRPGSFDLSAEYGVPPTLVEALDVTTQLAIAAGLDALREAGLPLVQTWRRTRSGRHLPDRWMLPESLRDETGVIFASAFPGYDRFADEMARYYTWDARRQQRALLEDLRQATDDPRLLEELARRASELDERLQREPYAFDRRFLLRVLAMGHSQFAEYVGARGPNTQLNVACASTASAIALAEDWIRAGRCRRVVVLGADDVTSERLLPWLGAGFLAAGAAATDERIEDAALPFDRRRHGMLVGMGACALVVESQDAVEERGMRGIVEVLSTETRNSAYHATRLDVDHIAQVMESLVASAEKRFGVSRLAMAPATVFMSHETFTPARGGSASAEVAALRRTFGEAAGEIVVANTKGFTGHPMGVGVEDVIALKILEHGIVPPVPNYKEPDPELGPLNLSRGGRYPLAYAIHLAAGFGSQIAMTLTRRVPGALDRVESLPVYRRWLADVSGDDTAETEVVKRTLRVKAHRVPARPSVPSSWAWGTAPARRTPAAGNGIAYASPAPLAMAAPAALVRPSMPEPLPVAQSAREPVAVAAPLPAPEPVQLTPPPAVAPSSADAVLQKVLAIVAEKTGYPPDMLDPELDLEADLGVDTVKQAETFAAVREAYGIPRQESLKLRDFPTLRHVVKFVLDHRSDLAARPEPVAAPMPVPAPVAEAPAPSADAVLQKVLAIVADKTGYPPDMLDPELDLEADLGVDTVKQAETFAAVREAYGIPRQEALNLRDFPTLRHVVKFVLDHRSDLAAPPAPVAAPAPAPIEPAVSAAPRAARPEDADRFPRRVPVPSLRPPLDVCAPTGVRLAAGTRVVVAADEGGVAAALSDRLAALGVEVVPVDPALDAGALTELLVRTRSAGDVDGVFWLPAVDVEPPLEWLDPVAFHEQARRRVKSLHETMRTLCAAGAGSGPFLIAGTCLGGLFGLDAAGASAPLGGAVAGYAKAYKKERPGATVKSVDFEPDAATGAVAEALIEEAVRDPGVVEVGRHQDLRWTVALEERPAADGAPGLELGTDTVFVVTGAAGGITSAIVADLAAASGGTFHLLDLAPLPRRDDGNVALLRAGRERLRAALIEEARARGDKPTPAAMDRELFAVERAEAALRAVEAVEAAGGRAVYHSLDLRDANAVTAALTELRGCAGGIVVVHAAGLEVSRRLEEKTAEEFARIFDVKAEGFFNLMWAARDLPVRAAVAFGSVAGRFGNVGQVDYSAANAFLAALCSHVRRELKATRALTIDWTAWAGIGMASRGSIPAVMAAAGIETLPPEVGVPILRHELVAGGFAGEVVVAGRLGQMDAALDDTGGLDVAALQARLKARERPLVLMGAPQCASASQGLVVETVLDPGEQPFLRDHQMDGTPLLPGVMGTEAFVELATVLCPGWRVSAVEDEQFLVPFKFHRMRPATLRLSAAGRPGRAEEVVVQAALFSSVQPRADVPPQSKLHFQATLRMTRAPAAAPTADVPARQGHQWIEGEAIYRTYFHGPAYRVLERVGLHEEEAIGLMAGGLPADESPANAEELFAPRLVELCFQTAGVWLLARRKTMALPASVGRLRVHLGPEEASTPIMAVVRARPDGLSFDARVIDEMGRVFVELEDYRVVPLPEPRTLVA
jgi:malonyl CoA-acyl carrier protein transacylase